MSMNNASPASREGVKATRLSGKEHGARCHFCQQMIRVVKFDDRADNGGKVMVRRLMAMAENLDFGLEPKSPAGNWGN